MSCLVNREFNFCDQFPELCSNDTSGGDFPFPIDLELIDYGVPFFRPGKESSSARITVEGVDVIRMTCSFELVERSSTVAWVVMSENTKKFMNYDPSGP